MQDFSLNGQLLLSKPSAKTQDDVFTESVVYVCRHDKKGTLGLILNRPLENISTLELMLQFDLHVSGHLADAPVFFGGPVDVSRGFVLSWGALEDSDTKSIHVKNDLWLSTNLNAFRFLEKRENEKLNGIKITLGYAGWTEGQLEEEINQGQWLLSEEKPSFIFETPAHELWQSCLKRLGVDPLRLSSHVEFV
tara:strand:+ start:441 stop:1019 length:579 start_codon:yes stop_codon:yes gene_type:complete